MQPAFCLLRKNFFVPNALPPQRITLSFFQQLTTLLIQDRRDLIAIISYGAFVSLFSLITPIAVQTFVNTLGFGMLMQPILILSFIVFCILSFSAILRVLQAMVSEMLQQRLFARLAMSLAQNIPRYSLACTLPSSSELKSNIAQIRGRHQEQINYFFEISTVQKTLNSLLLDGISIVLQITLGMIVIAFYHPFLLALDGIIVLFIGLCLFGLGKPAIRTSVQESKTKYAVFNWLEHLLNTSFSFKPPAAQTFAIRVADELTSAHLQSRKKHFAVLMKQTIGALTLEVIVSSALLGIGGWLVIRQEISLGQLVASELIVNSVVAGIGKLGKYLESFYDLAASMDKFAALLAIPTERTHGEDFSLTPHPLGPLVRVRHLEMRDSPQQPLGSFQGVHFELAANGDSLAIFSPAAIGGGPQAGFLLRYLMALDQPPQGILQFQGIDQRHWSLAALRSQIGYWGNADFFEGTLLQNLQMGREELDLRELQQLLQDLGMRCAIENLPAGLLTPLHRGHEPLGWVMNQKLMLVRQLVQKPKLLLIDGVFDHMDLSYSEEIMTYLNTQAPYLSWIVTTEQEKIAKLCKQTLALADFLQVKPREQAVSFFEGPAR